MKTPANSQTGTCICTACPTYNECMRADEGSRYCSFGRAENCTFERKGCLCTQCPSGSSRPADTYPCIRGSPR